MALHPSLMTSAAIPAIGPDAELIQACNAFAALEVWRQHPKRTDEEDADPDNRAAHEAAYKRLFEFRATTSEGFQARARAVAMYLYPDDLNGEWHWCQVGALLRDMLALPDPGRGEKLLPCFSESRPVRVGFVIRSPRAARRSA